MNPAILEYRIGDQFDRVFQWRNADKPVDLSGSRAIFEVATSMTNTPLISKEVEADLSGGDVFIQLSSAETASLTAGHYMGRVSIIYPGDVKRSTSWFVLRAKRGRA